MFFPGISEQFSAIVRDLKGQRVAVAGHLRPDGDCIGSQVALTRMLIACGIDAIAVNEHEAPRTCQTFLGDTPFFTTNTADLENRVLVTTDCAGESRLGKELLARFPQGAFFNVDHHISNEKFAKHNLIVADASATAEILAGVFVDEGFPVDPVTAQACYVGIATDTGQFRFSSTTRRVFEICCELIRFGADPATAARELYENEPYAKIELLQHFLASLRFECEGKVCIGILGPEAWERTGAKREDAEGLVDYARAIEGVDIGVLLEDRNGVVKGSLRSKDPIHRVDRIASSFNGGGHACAAGFNPHMGLQEIYAKLVEELQRHFSSLEVG